MKATVLVVDDERVFRVMAEQALVAEGFEVRTAATLARARAELARSTPDVLILDRRLPDGDGVSLLEEVRADAGSGVVAIVVTAYGDVGERCPGAAGRCGRLSHQTHSGYGSHRETRPGTDRPGASRPIGPCPLQSSPPSPSRVPERRRSSPCANSSKA